MKNNPNLQNLRHQSLLQLRQFLLVCVMAPTRHHHLRRCFPLLHRQDDTGATILRSDWSVLGPVLYVRARRDVDQEGDDGAHHGDETKKGEVFPWVVGGDLAVGECVEGVREDMDEGGGEDDAGGEAFDEEEGVVVGGLALEEAGEGDRGGDSDDAREEDDKDGDQL